MNKINKFVFANGFAWYNFQDNSSETISYLRKNFHFEEADLKNVALPTQRPRLYRNPSYLFMILLFPVFLRKERIIVPSEVDFFLGPNYLITVHRNELPPLRERFSYFKTQPDFPQNAAKLCESIFEALSQYCTPILDHIAWDIDALDKKLLSDMEEIIIRDILKIKRNIVGFRKSVQGLKTVYEELEDAIPVLYGLKRYSLEHIIEESKVVWEVLENHRETIDALQTTNESLLSFRLNSIIKTLTIMSFVVFPLNLLAAVFSMNTLRTPIVEHPQGFWIIVIIMSAGTAAMFMFFKIKKWL